MKTYEYSWEIYGLTTKTSCLNELIFSVEKKTKAKRKCAQNSARYTKPISVDSVSQ